MSRVLFIAAPFKARMIESMAVHFKHIQPLIVVPSHPPLKGMSMRMKVDAQLFGDRRLKRAFLEFQPELVYSDSALDTTQVKLSLLAKSKVPLVVHLRGDWWREYYSWFSAASWVRRAWSALQYSYNSYALAKAVKITPICKWLDKVVKSHLPWKRTEVIYQGVDPSQFNRTSETFPFQKPAVALIQNHTIYPKVAGLERFADVMKKMPWVNFYIAEGEVYDQRYMPGLRKVIAQVANAHFVKSIDRPDSVRKMLNSADLYVLASGLDCCPTTVLEASLMRKPVVASRVGGVPEIILEDKTGWTVPNEATDMWIERISTILRDRKLGEEFGRNGREWVVDRFAWQRIAAHVERLILNEINAS